MCESMRKRECVFVCVRAREHVCDICDEWLVCVCLCLCVCVAVFNGSSIVCVCVCMRKRERVCVFVCHCGVLSHWSKVWVLMCVCVCKGELPLMSVCVSPFDVLVCVPCDE